MGRLSRDLGFGAKILWKGKGFALAAIATLALCLGANAAIFTIVDSVLFEPLPLPESDRLVLVYNSYPKAGVERASNGVPDYYDRLRELGEVFEEQAMYNFPGLTIGEEGRPERLQAMAVTPSFFRLARVDPALGRTFHEGEGEPGNESRVVLSHALWRQRFGGDEGILGKDIRLQGEPYTVVGVMPRGFVYLDPDVRMWIPLAFDEDQKSDQARHSNNWEFVGRLREGASLEQVRQRLDALTAANHERFPHFREVLNNAGYHVQAHRLKDEVVRDVRGVLYLLWAGALFVLLIGAVNITNLVLARSRVRLREFALRSALGAGRWTLARQLLTENVLLAVVSAAAGLALGYWGLSLLASLGLGELPRGSEIRMSAATVGFTLLLSTVVGLAMGVLPLGQLWRLNLGEALGEEGRSGTAGARFRMVRNALVTVQVVFAFVLLTGAGLLLVSFYHVLSIDPGFRDGERILTGSVSLPAGRYPEGADQRNFYSRTLERLRALPGVAEAGVTSTIPFGGSQSDSVILAEGYVMEPGESLVSPSFNVVSPGYFESMGIDLIEGRTFDGSDVPGALATVIVDQRLARRFWSDSSPLGRRLYFPNDPQDLLKIDENTRFFTVVGVVRDVKLRALVDPDERVGAYYFPLAQTPRRRMTFAVKAAGSPAGLAESVRRELAAIDAELPWYDVQTMQQRLDDSLVSRKSPMLLVTAFGAAALLLAAVGIYGVLAYLVTQRTREVGIRIALGSSTAGIFRLILREGVVIVGAGILLGLAGAFALARTVASLLYGVQPLDPSVIVAAVVVLGAVALAACAMPALRATRIDPVKALSAQ